MLFDEFVEKVVDTMPNYLLEFDFEKIRIEEIKKNNGVTLTGMMIVLKDENITPTIYLNSYFVQYNLGKDFDDVMLDILNDYKAMRLKTPTLDEEIFDYNNIKDKIILKLVNYEKNKEVIEDAPYIPFHDLAVTFRMLVSTDENCIASALVRNFELEKWDISVEDLYKNAFENMRKIFPPYVKNLNDKIKEMDPTVGCLPESNILILSNDRNINGAVYMLYKDIISEVATKFSSNLFLIPSSINEILIVPEDSELQRDYLEEIVHDVNEYAVSETDFLSDTVYYYDRDKQMILI